MICDSGSMEDVMTDDKSNIPEKYDLDLDELSDDKPIVINTKKFKPENRVDFTKTSELLRLSMTISEVNGGHNRSSTNVSYLAYHRLMNSIT